VPKDRYDIVVASLYQMPVDPYEQPNSHRPLDFWGRNLLDHLFTLLPKLLAEGGAAYVMQLSILGQERTAELLAEGGFQSRVVDFEFFAFHSLFEQRKDQIDRVEELSDAYHLRFRDEDVMVAYLLEGDPRMTSPTEFLFTSRVRHEGHPDKIADQISDGVLDAVLRGGPAGARRVRDAGQHGARGGVG
jgi:hypothetical protein